MRIILMILLSFYGWTLLGQVSEYVILPEPEDTVYFKTDKSPLINNAGLLDTQMIIDLSQLKSSLSQQIVVKKYVEKYHDFSGADLDGDYVLEQNGRDRLILKKERKGIDIVARISDGPVLSIEEYMTDGGAYIHRVLNDEKEWATIESHIVNQENKMFTNRILGPMELVLPDAKYDVLGIRSTELDSEEKGSLRSNLCFYAKGVVFPVARINFLGEVIESIDYQIFDDIQKSFYDPNSFGRKDIIAHPNPTFGPTRLEFNNHPEGKYTVNIYNIVGKKIWGKSYEIGRNGVIKEDFSFLPKGTYLFSVIDALGKKITTKRLVIITP